MNWRSVYSASIFTLCAALAACSGGQKDHRGSTMVTIAVSSGSSAAAAPGLQKAAPLVTTLRFTISAPDMSTITKEEGFSFVGGGTGTVEESFDVPNGYARTFLVEALDAEGYDVYAGTNTADLTGDALDLPITMKKQYFTGTQMLGTANLEEGNALARDSSGNLIVAGITYGNLDGNLNSMATLTSPDVFVAKYDISGAKLWTREFGTGFPGTGFDIANGVAVDASGNIFVVGSTSGNLNGELNADPSLTGADAFIVKLNPDGNILWTRLIGSADLDYAQAVATDSSGNAYVTGYTDGSLGTFLNAGKADLFTAKYDAAGTLQWLDQRGTLYDDLAEGITVDSSGNVLLTGFTDGNLDGNVNNALVADSTADVFVVKYTSAGSWQWTTAFGTADLDQAWSIAADSSGNAYVAGSTWSTLDSTNPNPDATGYSADLFAAKIDTNGGVSWIRQLGSSSNDIGLGVAVDANGYVDVTGMTDGSLDGNTSAGGYDVFAVKYDTSGAKQWTRQLGTAGDDEGYGIAVNTRGNLFIAGTTEGDFDGIANAGSTDVFLMSYDKNGEKQ